MPELITFPPYSPVEPVTEILHGVPVTDHYRWLEDQNSPRTRAWIKEQTRYARTYLDSIPGRDIIRKRIREFLAVETYDSVLPFGSRYFFRKRLPDQEQPCICMRDGADGEDQVLIDPADLGSSKYTGIKPLKVSPNGRLLLYEIKQGGERTGTFELLDIESRKKLPDALSRGYLRGFAFAPDGNSFYYVHDAVDSKHPFYRAVFHHELGSSFSEDCEIFTAGEGEQLRLHLISGRDRLGFLVYRFLEKTYTDFYLWPCESQSEPEMVVANAEYSLGPLLLPDRIVAITDRNAPNLRIAEVNPGRNTEPGFVDIVPETDTRISQWVVAGNRILVTYIHQTKTRVVVFDLSGKRIAEIPIGDHETVRLTASSPENEEVFLEAECFTKPISVFVYSPKSRVRSLWARRKIPYNSSNYTSTQVWYKSKDGTQVPMFLMGRHDVLESGIRPTIMTSYGGYGVSMTPQFSVFVAFLAEQGCLFALPNIRGGGEFGIEWHNAAKRRRRQTAYDDFLSAAEWLIKEGRTTPDKVAIFGGSNSGLLVAAALTQRPDLFRAVVCMVPMLDMLRYHLFDGAHVWREEFGIADDPDDFEALARYSPYHHVRDGVTYPAVMFVSGDADRNCNPLHARKMTARLQAANASSYPVFLDYNRFRGHSPVLPLSERVKALTDRMAFLCDQLKLSVG
jgi:prolyl oligopeptidase